MNSKFLTNPVKPVEVRNSRKISELLGEMSCTGFQGRKLGEAFKIWEEMLRDKNLTIIMGIAGSLSTAGQWKIINWLVENRFIDVLVSTGANISEDIVEAIGFNYWQGSPALNDSELLMNDLNRYHDVIGKESEYLKMENLLTEFILEDCKENHPYSSPFFLHKFGQWLSKKGIRSIVAVAYEYSVPVFCPAIVDSSYGDAALIAKSKGFNLVMDQIRDYEDFMKIGSNSEKVGVIYVGGGVPKDFIQLMATSIDLLLGGKKLPQRQGGIHISTQENYYPHKYAIQITTDSPQWGGLSGATLEEAISWGKIHSEGKHVTCYCDATIALPLIAHALADKVKSKRKGPSFPWLFESEMH